MSQDNVNSPIYYIDDSLTCNCNDNYILNGNLSQYSVEKHFYSDYQRFYDSVLKSHQINLLKYFNIGYRYYECNPKTDHYNEPDDCVIRAICKFFNVIFGEAVDMLSKAAISIGYPLINSDRVITKLMNDHGYHAFYKLKLDQSAYGLTLFDFVMNPIFKQGKYLININHPFPHTIVYENGIIYDNFTDLRFYNIVLFCPIISIFTNADNPIFEEMNNYAIPKGKEVEMHNKFFEQIFG